MRVRGPRPGDRTPERGRIIPVHSVPPWIGNPNWGSKTDRGGLPADGKFLTLAEVKTEDESTQVMTVTIQANTLIRSQEPGAPIAIGGPVAAKVEFGSYGGEFTMVVDVYNGIQFSIAASWIRVSVFNEAIFNPQSSGQLPVQASASISLLPTSKNQPITKTVLAVNNGAGNPILSLLDTKIAPASGYTIPLNEFQAPFSPEGLFFQIPLFAKSLLVHSANQADTDSGPRTIRFLKTSGTAISIYVFVAGEKQFEPIPIPPGTTQINIFNDDAVNTQSLIPQFFLEA
jgi:hypothetical protein